MYFTSIQKEDLLIAEKRKKSFYEHKIKKVLIKGHCSFNLIYTMLKIVFESLEVVAYSCLFFQTICIDFWQSDHKRNLALKWVQT